MLGKKEEKYKVKTYVKGLINSIKYNKWKS